MPQKIESDAPRKRGRPPKAIDGGLGWRLRHFRGEAGLTIAQVAERAGIAPSTLIDWEQTTDPVWLDTLGKIAAAIGVPAELLLIASADEPREVRAAQKSAKARRKKAST